MAVVSQTEKNKVNVPSKAPTGAVDGAVKGVLSGKFLEGLTTMINGALNTVLGSSFGGEIEKQDFHVVFAKNSLCVSGHWFVTWRWEGPRKSRRA